MPSSSIPRLTTLFREHPDILAAGACALLVFCGWLTLNIGWLGLSLLILPAAYVIGGYESAREGLTTLFQEKELDVDLLMIVAALGAASLGLWRREYYLIVDGAVLIQYGSVKAKSGIEDTKRRRFNPFSRTSVFCFFRAKL